MINTTIITTKFWFINDLERFLTNSGINNYFAELIAFITAAIMLGLVIFIIDIISTRLLLRFIQSSAYRTKSKWDDFLVERKFFRRSLRFAYTLLLITAIETLFNGFDETIVNSAIVIVKCLSIFLFLMLFNAFIDAANDVYMTQPISKEKSIKGYIQTLKIAMSIICIILSISVIFNVGISKILLSLATSAAILTLVFKDTILGFIASIQLSAQDMVRLGDWVVMESRGANGTVIDITVTTVKIKNWDQTTAMVPIYALVSEAFINWRSMEHGTGRRMRIPLNIDARSVEKIDKERLKTILERDLFKPYKELITKDLTIDISEGTTNLSLFRAYAEAYVTSSSIINSDMTLLVRYTPMNSRGITMEIYAFSLEKKWYKHEKAVTHITEQMFTAMIELNIRLFQPITDEIGR